ncbi:MAG: type II toxin-antitoxin system ParD family antitoxin [Thermoguttaceae bacterium]|jgi:Arc/MetJ-type ribon-helix-helix transcriptional regulator|nr:type II toxin-antitoxin system ParD family antitoxin [Thermoguttaceae bacterium]
MSGIFPEDVQQFVKCELATGRYHSTRELVLEGLRLLQRERAESVEGIRAGLNDFRVGRFQTLDEAFADLRQDMATTTRE